MTAPVAILDGKPVTAAEVDVLVAGLMGDIFGPLGAEEEREALRVLAVEDLMRPQLPPAYSTDIAAAWRVITERNFWLPTLTYQCGIFRGAVERMGWFCDFRSSEHHGYAAADTAPLAICLAALLASGACKTAEAVGTGRRDTGAEGRHRTTPARGSVRRLEDLYPADPSREALEGLAPEDLHVRQFPEARRA